VLSAVHNEAEKKLETSKHLGASQDVKGPVKAEKPVAISSTEIVTRKAQIPVHHHGGNKTGSPPEEGPISG